MHAGGFLLSVIFAEETIGLNKRLAGGEVRQKANVRHGKP
jgi:hypothetical protein